MKNNIFSPDWHYKKYYLGYVNNANNKEINLDVMFYSHEQRFLVKIRDIEDVIRTEIVKVFDFNLSDAQAMAFYMNRHYLKPSSMVEMIYRELPEDIIKMVSGGVTPFFPEPIGMHEDDIILYDDELEVCIPVYSSDSQRYKNCRNMLAVAECSSVKGETDLIKAYPERMVRQIMGKSNDDMCELKVFLSQKKVRLLGVSYVNPASRDTSEFVALYFQINNELYQLLQYRASSMEFTNYRFEKVKSVNEFIMCNVARAEFYYYGKNVEVQEHNPINTAYTTGGSIWELGNEKHDFTTSLCCWNYFRLEKFLSSKVFVFSLDSSVCKARILTSKMEQIKGSSFNVKYKRFLQKVASVVEK